MNKIVSLLAGFVALLTCTISAGQDNPIKDKSLLWRISGNHLKKPSYLFGTIHMICRDDFMWTKKMNECLRNSEKVCFEMNLNDPNVIAEASTALMEGLGKKLMDSIGDDQLKIMQSFLKDSMGNNKSFAGQSDPMAMQSMFGLGGLNCTNPVSYEDSIMKMALVDKKEIMGIEEPAEQIAVLETIPLDSLLGMLLESSFDKQTPDSEGDKLTIAYKNQDLPELYELITDSKGQGIDMGVFLDDRNKKWIPRMSDKMKLSSVFFAVGAGHLAGENGVINLLREAGYTVEPVK